MGKAKIRQKKTEYDGVLFDSALEAKYYAHLKEQPDVRAIALQPEYELIQPFYVPCRVCRGDGQRASEKTGKNIQCSSCKGSGASKRPGMKYTADFKVTYQNGYEEVIDVKGGFVNESFPLRRKVFEWVHKQRLFVVTRKKGEWVKK